MTLGGWITMLLSVGFVTALFLWCIALVMRTPGATDRLHAQADIDPHDQEA